MERRQNTGKSTILLFLLISRVICGDHFNKASFEEPQFMEPARPWQQLPDSGSRRLSTMCRCNLTGSNACCEIDPKCPPILSADLVPEHFKLNTTWYKKLVWAAGGIPVVGSGNVSDAALLETAMIINRVCRHRPEICGYVADNGVQMTVMARYPLERIKDVPEHHYLPDYYNQYRGVGSTCYGRLTTCAEENVLCYSRGKCTVIHEIAHSFHMRGMAALYPDLYERVREFYDNRDQTLFHNRTYASKNQYEFFAEVSTEWFNCGHKFAAIADRQGLKEKVPELWNIMVAAWGTDNADSTAAAQRCPITPCSR